MDLFSQWIKGRFLQVDHKRRSPKRNRKKWRLSDSSGSDSVELVTWLSGFHWVISALTTPTTTPSVQLLELFTVEFWKILFN